MLTLSFGGRGRFRSSPFSLLARWRRGLRSGGLLQYRRLQLCPSRPLEPGISTLISTRSTTYSLLGVGEAWTALARRHRSLPLETPLASGPGLNHGFTAPPLVHLVRLAGLQWRRKPVPSGLEPVTSGSVVSEPAGAASASAGRRRSEPRSSGSRPISLRTRLGIVERRLPPSSGHRRSFSTWQGATSPPLISCLSGRWCKAGPRRGYKSVSILKGFERID
jgi:hypothetical protein